MTDSRDIKILLSDGETYSDLPGCSIMRIEAEGFDGNLPDKGRHNHAAFMRRTVVRAKKDERGNIQGAEVREAIIAIVPNGTDVMPDPLAGPWTILP